MQIDAELRIWQRNEQPISILEVPYQNLKTLVLKASGRVRNRAEWHREVSSKRGRAPLEIDNDISRIAPTLDEEGKGMLRVVQIGGSQTLDQIADYNEDVGRTCTYCHEAVTTSDHIRWECKRFDPLRREINDELASIPHKWIPCCLKNGIAPAMEPDGRKTYWGTDFSNDSDEKRQETLRGEP